MRAALAIVLLAFGGAALADELPAANQPAVATPVASHNPPPGFVPPKPTPANVSKPEDYPPGGLALGEQGDTVLNIVIHDDGTVSEAQVAKSSGFADLDNAAVKIVQERFRYTPATQDGKPVAAQWTVKVSWRLQDAAIAYVMDMPPAYYPQESVAAKEEGVTGIFIAIKGHTITLIVPLQSSGSPRLDKAALDYVRGGRLAVPMPSDPDQVKVMVLFMRWSPPEKLPGDTSFGR